MSTINFGRHADFDTAEINSTLRPYISYGARADGYIKSVEIYVKTPPTVLQTIGFKKSFFGSPTCIMQPPLADYPTDDFMVIEYATSTSDTDCYYTKGELAIFTTSGNPVLTSSGRLGGYTDPFFGSPVVPYFKVSTVEPFTTQDSGDIIFILGFSVFFSAMIFFGLIYSSLGFKK